MCIDAKLFDEHHCRQGKYMSNCPVCQEDLFRSRDASHEMPCGHAIHWHCFKDLTSYDTRCPVCKKTAESPDHMAATWSAIAMGIALQPVPAELTRAVDIMCNDCERTATNRRWHFLGVRCLSCLSFNTIVERIVMSGLEAADLLNRLDQSRANSDGVPSSISAPAIYSAFPSVPDDAMDEDL
jgi:RING finger and CHY zinc finger domain-containing protein 1